MTREFIRYLFAGGGAFLLDYACLFILVEYVGLHYLIAASAAFLIGLTFTYLLSVFWVFDHRSCDSWLQEFSIFAAIGIVGLIANAMLIWMLTEVVGFHYLISKAGAAGLIFVLNFAVRRLLLFRPRCEESPA